MEHRPARYRVIGVNSERTGLALRDESGRCHIARVVLNAPGLDETLLGDGPAIGFNELSLSGARGCCTVVFVALDCAEGLALMLLETDHSPH
jgi:hypothetical protein